MTSVLYIITIGAEGCHPDILAIIEPLRMGNLKNSAFVDMAGLGSITRLRRMTKMKRMGKAKTGIDQKRKREIQMRESNSSNSFLR